MGASITQIAWFILKVIAALGLVALGLAVLVIVVGMVAFVVGRSVAWFATDSPRKE